MVDIEKNSHNWNGSPIVFGPEDPPSFENTDRFTVVDLFSGPGGLSEGFKLAGFLPVLGSDLHEVSVDTYRKNNPQAYTILGDIQKITQTRSDTRSVTDILEDPDYGTQTQLSKISERLPTNQIDVLTGGIPCQGFSLANKKQDDEDERNYLFEEMIRATKILDPTVILLENVSSMTSAKDGQFIEDIHTCFERLGYQSEHNILLASDYGVPQKRERLFFIAQKEPGEIHWPEKTTPDTSVTVGDAILDLEELQPAESGSSYKHTPANTYQEQMRSNSNEYTNHTSPRHQQQTIDRIQNTNPGEPMYERFKQRIRLDPTEPSPTIVSGGIRPQFQLGHPTQDRGLTVRERARIQSFPDTFIFEGGVTQGRVQTGMAVPPLLAEKLAITIKHSLE